MASVSVAVRLRPFLPREKQVAVTHVNGNTVNIKVEVEQLVGAPEYEQRQFVFDLCLGQDASQKRLYEEVGEPIIENALSGLAGTLFAYGQTGSGKSFSIMGTNERPGVIPQLIERLFQVVTKDTRQEPASEMRVCMSFLEIYNEELKDLLDPSPRTKKLYVHQHPKLGVYVPNLTEAALTGEEECHRLLAFGAKIRATAQTNMNSTSSRSHSVLTLRMTQIFPDGKIRNSSINLCDLAGSERAKKSGAQGQRMREGASINNSLSVLGQVISKLSAGADRKGVHVPFRQSKLTYLLTDALSGNSVTTMLANVSPAESEAEETLSTLRFAESVKKVKTKPHVNELAPEEPAILLESFRSEIEMLQQALIDGGSDKPKPSNVTRAIEASQHLMRSISERTGGAQWAEAVEKTRALEALQEQLIKDMRLPVHEVGQLAGAQTGTPFFLNISDDPALSGCLLYFLRSLPEINTVGSTGANSIAPNTIVLRGLGIPAQLCEIFYRVADGDNRSQVSIRKVCDDKDGRLLKNGSPLPHGQAVELRHGDRIIFGWAFCFRLVMCMSSTPPQLDADGFRIAADEMLQYSMTSTMEGISMMRAAGHWQSEFSRRSIPEQEATRLMTNVSELMVKVEEANALCREVQRAVPSFQPIELEVGWSFGFMSFSSAPAVMVQVWKRGKDKLLGAWPAADFDQHIDGLRDLHRKALKEGPGVVKHSWQMSNEDWWAVGSTPDFTQQMRAEGSDSEAEGGTDSLSVRTTR
mmetsp:Transcript_2583/g.6593  ORF Transcript_2583/g.6593 Transcript_2583/m.6593 type:complete len:754 (-) Transcript_2583:4-2265(-)